MLKHLAVVVWSPPLQNRCAKMNRKKKKNRRTRKTPKKNTQNQPKQKKPAIQISKVITPKEPPPKSKDGKDVPSKEGQQPKVLPPWRLGGGGQRERILIQISEFVYVRTLLIVSLMGLLLYLLYHLRGVLMPVLVALVLAYLINPLVDRMQKWGLGRNVSIWFLVFLLFTSAFFGAAFAIPAIVDSISRLGTLIAKLPPLLLKAKVWLEATLGVHFPKTWVGAIHDWGKEITTYVPTIIKPARELIEMLFSGGMGLLARFFTLLLIPLFTFYFLKGFHALRHKAVDYIPLSIRDRALLRLGEIDRMISGFIRGQLIVSLIVGSLYLVLLSILQVPMAPAIAAGGAILNIVPYLGFLLTFLFALVAALIEFQLQWPFFAVFFGMGIIHMIDVLVITPSVVGEQVGLSEVVVIFAVLAGGQLFGFIGVLLAVPSAAILKVVLSECLELYRTSSFFTGNPRA